jgi:2-C-methyl-D-erythritol 4-phosphate cytidylyltransferase
MTSVTVLPCADVPAAEQIWTIVVGGGSGRRFGTTKQYEQLGEARVIDRSVAVAHEVSDGVIVVVPADDADREGAVAGGVTRSDSVRAGLRAVPADASIICVHDAARPLATADLYRRVIDAIVEGADAAVPALAVSDTIKVVADGVVVSTPDRGSLVAVQTPQAFRADALRRAHERDGDATDDAALVEALGGLVVVVAGEAINRKITVPDDLEWARRLVGAGTGEGRP